MAGSGCPIQLIRALLLDLGSFPPLRFVNQCRQFRLRISARRSVFRMLLFRVAWICLPRKATTLAYPQLLLQSAYRGYFLTSGNKTAASAGGTGVSRVTLTWLVLSAIILLPARLLAWTNGELLIWMDNARADAVKRIAQKFENDLGIKVSIERRKALPPISRWLQKPGKVQIF